MTYPPKITGGQSDSGEFYWGEDGVVHQRSKEIKIKTLPTEHKSRKEVPIASGVLDYFPDAIAAVAAVSFKGNQQHNPGEPLHWAREKSTDHTDCLIRHFMERGTMDDDGLRHSAKMVWRALAILQLEIEANSKQTLTVGDVYTVETNQPLQSCHSIEAEEEITKIFNDLAKEEAKNKKRKINGRTTKARNKNR